MKCTKERCYLNVKADRLEKVVLDTLTKHCFTDENLRLVAAASEYGIDELPASPVTGRITELEQKIQRATDRIAGDVLNDEEFVAVVKIRREWLDELNELKKSIPKADKEPETNLPADLKELRELLEQPELADRSLMRDVFLELVDSVTVWRTHGQEFRCLVTLNPAYCFGRPIALEDSDIFVDRGWRQICEVVKGKEMTLREVSEAVGKPPSNVCYALRLGCERGLLTKTSLGTYRY